MLGLLLCKQIPKMFSKFKLEPIHHRTCTYVQPNSMEYSKSMSGTASWTWMIVPHQNTRTKCGCIAFCMMCAGKRVSGTSALNSWKRSVPQQRRQSPVTGAGHVPSFLPVCHLLVLFLRKQTVPRRSGCKVWVYDACFNEKTSEQ